jgi:thiol-disulfide isomerase/thioredoxin
MPSNTSKVQAISPLKTHEEFEQLFNPSLDSPPPSYPILINFTASWCGPCKRVDWQFLLEEFGQGQFATIYKCDVDENKYTPGFCGARSIPAWAIITAPRKMIGPVQISETSKVAAWIFTSLRQTK